MLGPTWTTAKELVLCAEKKSLAPSFKEPDVLEIIALLDKGDTVASVAKQFSVSKFTIYEIASVPHRAGLPRTEGFSLRGYRVGNRRTKITEAKVLEVVSLLKEGHSHRATAAVSELTHGTIRDIAAGRSWRPRRTPRRIDA